jgi:hypothetical protein
MNTGTALGAAQVAVSALTLGAVVVLLARVFVATAPAPETARASLDQMKYSAYTNAQAAHVTVTNMNLSETHWACIEGVVTSKSTHSAASTVAVCTGDMKPHTTVVLEAPYKPGAIMDMCSTEVGEGRFARKELDWDLCDFEVINAKSLIP